MNTKKVSKSKELVRKSIAVTEYLWRDVRLTALRDGLTVSEFVQKALWRAVHKGSGEDLNT